MKRLLTALALCLLLMGQNCEPEPPPDPVPVNTFCHGTPVEEPGVVANVLREYDRHGMRGSINAIIGGDPASERLATVYLRMINGGACSAGIIGPHSVLTAGHCKASELYRICTDPLRYETCSETTEALPHPDYQRWYSQREAPQSDLRLLFFPDEVLPGYIDVGNGVIPDPDEVQIEGVYQPGAMAAYCKEIRALGHGQWKLKEDSPYRPEGEGCEDENNDGQPDCLEFTCPDADEDGEPDSRCLLEAEYQVVDVDRYGRTPHASQLFVEGVKWQWKCFGDSGSILYARVEGHPVLKDGWYMAGVTSTVNSTWCVTGGTDVNLFYFRDWIGAG